MPILDILSPVIGKLLDFIPDPAKKAEAQLKIQQELDANQQAIMSALTAVDKGQTDINTEEAKSTSLFVAGWRPFLGWTCGASFAWVYVLQPVAVFTLTAFHHPVALPTLDFSQMSSVLMGILGLSGMRTYEKLQNAQNNH